MPTVIFNPFRHGKEPDQVTGESASADSTTEITVSWNAVTASPPVTNYTITRSTSSGGTYSEIAESPTASTSVQNDSLSVYTEYFYKIQANNPVGRGAESGIATARTDGVVPATVTGLSVAVSSPNLVVSWNTATGGNPAVYTYTLQRSTSSGSGFTDLVTDYGSTSKTDDTVSMGTTYYYRVKAENAFGTSASWSTEASGSVPVPTWTAKTDYLYDMRFAGASSSSGSSFLYIAGNGLLSQIFSTSSSIWNGSTWTAKNTLSVGRAYYAGAGGSTSGASAVSGYTTSGGKTGVLEQFDGTNWSTPSGGTDTALTNISAGGQSTGSVIRFGGLNGGSATNSTSIWNGSSWSSSGNMGRSNYYVAGTGSGSSALQTGGSSGGGATTVTEKFTSGTWSTVASPTSDSKAAGMAGITSDAIRFGGFDGDDSMSTNLEYSASGNTWTARNSMPAAQWGGIRGCMGSTTSALWATSSHGGTNRKKVYQYG